MKGTIKIISSQLCFASCVRASRYAVGTAITVEHSTTHTPSSSELPFVKALCNLLQSNFHSIPLFSIRSLV